LAAAPPELARHLLKEAAPVVSASVLMQFEPEERERLLAMLAPPVARELRELVAYPEDSAGRLMDPVLAPMRAELSVGETLERLRHTRRRGLRELFVIDAVGKLTGRVEIQDLATA